MQIYTDLATVQRLRSDIKFRQILALARIVNTLFLIARARPAPCDETLRAQSAKVGLFFYLSGVLYEGLRFATRLSQHFRDSVAFQQGLQQLLRDKRTQHLRETVLRPLRHKGVFHYDSDAPGEALRHLRGQRVVMFEQTEETGGDGYFPLADLAILMYAFEDFGSRKARDDDFVKLLRKKGAFLGDVASSYQEAAQELIGEYLSSADWNMVDSADEKDEL